MKKLKNFKQSLLSKSIFKRLRNTINSTSSSSSNTTNNTDSVGASSYNQCTGTKLCDLLESSSTCVVNCNISSTVNATAVATISRVNGSSKQPSETISTSSLISKCHLKKENTLFSNNKNNKCEYDKINYLDSTSALESDQRYQVYISHYIGGTILSYDTSLEGSATKFISKIIDTVNFFNLHLQSSNEILLILNIVFYLLSRSKRKKNNGVF